MIDPCAKIILDAMHADARPMPGDTATWLAHYRAQLDALPRWQGQAPELVTVAAPGLRLYRPGPGARERADPWPTVLFCHGGGFVAGSLPAYDVPLRWLAIRAGWQVAAVDYRLAPEHPYPAAPDDCRLALEALARGEHGADPAHLAVMGDSAGGLLATVMAGHARDAGIPLLLQVLLYPNTDLRPGALYATRTQYEGVVIRMAELYRSLDLYLGTEDRTAPDISPICAGLHGLCPAMLITNEYDPLRGEAEAYAARLRDAGVDVTEECLPGMIHGVIQYAAAVPAGETLITRVAQALSAVG